MATTTRVLTASVNGTVYTSNANGALEAVDTCHSGATAPTDEVANGKFWLDTSTTPAILKLYNNAVWEVIGGSTSSPTFADGTFTGNITAEGSGTFTGAEIIGSNQSLTFTGVGATTTGGMTFNTSTVANAATIDASGASGDITIDADPTNVLSNTTIKLSVDGTDRVLIRDTGVTELAGQITVSNTTDSTGALVINSDGATANQWGLEIGTHSQSTESDIVLSGNAVIGVGTNLSVALGATNKFKVWGGATSRYTGTTGATSMFDVEGDTGNVTTVGSITTTTGIYLGGTAAANLLDDVEFGDWTPTVSSSGGGFSGTVSVNHARYRKIGRTVWVDAYISVNVSSVGSGGAVIGGLPFTVLGGYSPFKAAHGDLVLSNGGYFSNGGTTMLFIYDYSVSGRPIAGTGVRKMMISGHYDT